MKNKAVQVIMGIYSGTYYTKKIAKCPNCGEYEFILTSPHPSRINFNCAHCYRIFENFEPLLVPLEQVSISPGKK